jgi:anti-sigma B factor antagonist
MSTFAVDQPTATVTVIAFAEDVLGGAEALELTSLVREACATEQALVVFDLAKVRVMNSSGLGMLVGALATVRKHDARLVLAAVPEKVRSLLAMTQLAQVFDTKDSVAEAMSAG